MKDSLKIKTHVIVRKNGKVLAEGPNVVTLAGKNLVAERLQSDGESFLTHMAIGSSGLAAAESQTDLDGTEHERVAVTPTVVDELLTLEAEFGAGIAAPVTIQEFGLFNDDTAGVMFSRFITPVINADVGDEITVSWSMDFL